METKKMKKVLIAMDYDPTAQKVVEIGFSFAKAMGAEVILLHVITDGTYYTSLEYSSIAGFFAFSDEDVSHLYEPGGLKKAITHFLEKEKKHLGDESIQTIVKEGNFDEAIVKAAKELHADVIVMGSHSRRWLDEILIGSVTEKVLNKTTIPLFIVPTKKHD